MQKWLIAICLILSIPCAAQQQTAYADKVKKYVAQYKGLAIAEQKRSGIPASITLAQGILETEAGCSELVTGANNHFGIKCKSSWKGPTFAHTDDAPNECFRKYKCGEDSYKDHSDYLKNTPRYAELFKLKPTDYAGWCVGLKKCGYATSPVYAKKLIGIIEDYNLQEYTFVALNDKPVKPTVASVTLDKPSVNPMIKSDTAGSPISAASKTAIVPKAAGDGNKKPARAATDSNIVIVNGLRAVKGKKGDILLRYAMRYNIRYEKFLEINDLPDAPLYANMYLYLERKHTAGINAQHVVTAGENLQLIAQNEGMQLKRLKDFNLINDGEEPVPGDVLQLQSLAAIKPYLVKKQGIASKGKNIAITHEDFAINDSAAVKKTDPIAIAVAVPTTNSIAVKKADTAAIVAAPVTLPAKPDTIGIKVNTDKTDRLTPAPVTLAQQAVTQTITDSAAPVNATPTATNNAPAPIKTTTDSVSTRTAKIIHDTVAAATNKVEEIAVQVGMVSSALNPVTKDTVAAVTQTPTAPSFNTNVKDAPAYTLASTTKLSVPDVTSAVAEIKPATQPEIKPVPAEPIKEELPVTNTANNTTADEPTRSADDPLAKLKARLDKVVYAGDDDKTPTAVAPAETKQTVTDKTTMVVIEDESKYHTVKAGETAFSIAKKTGITIKQLRDWNKTVDLEQMNAGQRLKVKD